MLTSQFLALGLLLAGPLASAHCLITTATGDLGGNGTGLGVLSANDNTLNDVTVFKSAAGVFGATGASGNIVLAKALTTQIKLTGSTLPQISTTGTVTMTLHQINADGAGPMTCSVSTDATGKPFTAMTITTNVPGTNGKSNAANANFPLVAQMPAGVVCTGTVGQDTNVCVVKCANPVGPFGSNVLVQQAVGTQAVNATEAGNATQAASATQEASAKKSGSARKAGSAKKVGNAKKTGSAKKTASVGTGGSLAARAKSLMNL